ncbi:hypothetical protein Save01_02365 [Streptomyces avermitilis]|uniref:Uncharacterized protein n=1 Tax=Streptomyces avermitilis TaxID=33903 RepID=A0A4D4M998_STRAX|nr:hypothetical protein SAV14893_078690 [Streptomyces avermitilis]
MRAAQADARVSIGGQKLERQRSQDQPPANGSQIVQVRHGVGQKQPASPHTPRPPAVGQRVWRRTASRSWSMSSALWEKAVTNRTIPGSQRSW